MYTLLNSEAKNGNSGLNHVNDKKMRLPDFSHGFLSHIKGLGTSPTMRWDTGIPPAAIQFFRSDGGNRLVGRR